jgi:hypothetical protein
MRAASSYRIAPLFSKNEKDVSVSTKNKDELLNRTIREIITCNDSVAAVVTTFWDSLYVFRYLNLEDNQWLNGGEDAAEGLSATRKKVTENLTTRLKVLRKINEIKQFPTDTSAFVNYLKDYGMEPEQFILEALTNHKIVIYGETHRREISWQLMKSLINTPSFSKITGTIFMELSSDKQDALDQFFSNRELDPEIILTIFREFQLDGWYDKGSYEFLISLWKLNKQLPEKDKIKVIATDIPMPLSTLITKEDYQHFTHNKKDRNEQMADMIEQALKLSPDKRHSLFIVGKGHACKSPAIATEGEAGSRNSKTPPKHSAGYQLTERFSNKDVFSILSHSPGVNGKIRGGMFDYAFSCAGNKPLAFQLAGSPFGKEVFDGFFGIAYKEETGSFENNYDGYVFLGPLADEKAEYILYELVTDDFAHELIRRAILSGTENEKWFGVENKNLTKDAIISGLKKSAGNNKRWEGL